MFLLVYNIGRDIVAITAKENGQIVGNLLTENDNNEVEGLGPKIPTDNYGWCVY